MSETEQVERCINCGDEIEGEPVAGHGSLKDNVTETFERDESVPVGEVFEFDDGPYCSFTCLLDEDGDGDE